MVVVAWKHAPVLVQGRAAGDLCLKIVNTKRDGQIVRLSSPKCTIGSARGCTLRLRAVGVHPLHCVILRGERGTVARCWSSDTRLSGRAFTDALLVCGDRLAIGPIELEVVASSNADPLGEATHEASTIERSIEALQAETESLHAERDVQFEARSQQRAIEHNALEAVRLTLEQRQGELEREAIEGRAELERRQAGLGRSQEALRHQCEAFAREREASIAERAADEADLEHQRQAVVREREELARLASEAVRQQAKLDFDFDARLAELEQEQQHTQARQAAEESRLGEERRQAEMLESRLGLVRGELESKQAELDAQRGQIVIERGELAAAQARALAQQAEMEQARQELDLAQVSMQAERQAIATEHQRAQREAAELMVHKNERDEQTGDVALVAKPSDAQDGGDLAELAELRCSLRQQQAEIEAIRKELLGQRESLDAERLRAADRIAREAEDIERQREELAAEQAELAAERKGRSTSRPAPVEADEPEAEPVPSFQQDARSAASVAEEEIVEAEPVEAPAANVPRPAAAAHDDPTIEEYMANLLTRMRGGVTSEVISREPRPVKKPEPAPPRVAPAPAPPVDEPAMVASPGMVERTTAKAEQARRTQTMETRDLAKMRELANTQARIAIDLHGRKRLVKSMVGKLAISAVFLIATFIVLTTLPGDPALQTGALAGIVGAIYWLFGGASIAQKLKSEPTSRKAAIRKQIEAAAAAEKKA